MPNLIRPTVRGAGFAAAILVLAATRVGAADEPHNHEHGAHQHGHGRFNMAFEKQSVVIEIEMPGSDVVGFEHEARTEPEKAAVEAAKAKLQDPMRLFAISQSADCKLDKVDIDTSVGDQGVEQVAKPEKEGEAHTHTEFQAQYILQCAKPQEITALEFALFNEFPKAEAFEVFVLSDKGQMKAEATRKAPRVSLKGIWGP